jgi:hypothetical protein
MPYRVIHLCAEGWRLYDAWMDAIETHANPEVIMIAHDDLIIHREACAECTAKESTPAA